MHPVIFLERSDRTEHFSEKRARLQVSSRTQGVSQYHAAVYLHNNDVKVEEKTADGGVSFKVSLMKTNN